MASNTDDQVKSTTREACHLLSTPPAAAASSHTTKTRKATNTTKADAKADDHESRSSALSASQIHSAPKILTALRGIGPATASLILSSHEPSQIPFFSDELFRWLHADDDNNDSNDHKPRPNTDHGDRPGHDRRRLQADVWDRKIGYTAKEYTEVVRRTEEVRERLRREGRETGAREVECIAYVLGKARGEIDVEDEKDGDRDDEQGVVGKVEAEAKVNTDGHSEMAGDETHVRELDAKAKPASTSKRKSSDVEASARNEKRVEADADVPVSARTRKRQKA